MAVDEEGWIEGLGDSLPADKFKVRVRTDLPCVIEDFRSVRAIVDDQKAVMKHIVERHVDDRRPVACLHAVHATLACRRDFEAAEIGIVPLRSYKVKVASPWLEANTYPSRFGP
jgi:hypothetical protein